MKWYADTPAVRFRQITGDALVLAWIVLWIALADAARDKLGALADPAREIQQAGKDLSDQLHRAGERAADVPLLGDNLAAPLRSAARGGPALVEAGRSLEDAVETLALTVFLLLLVVPVGLVLARWLPRRVAWARQAGAVRALVRAGCPLTVFAHRAVVSAPITELSRRPAVLQAWAAGEIAAIDELARWELARLGVKGEPNSHQDRVGAPE